MRPAGEILRKRDWIVRDVSPDVARRLVKAYHYSGGCPNTGAYIHGLFRAGADLFEGQCLGIAWWLPPILNAAKVTEPDNPHGVLMLSRLAISPEVPTNGASFLLARSRALRDRDRWPTLVTWADKSQNHTGAIYLADNWQFDRETAPEARYTIEGRQVSRKSAAVTRSHAEMLALGAVFEGKFSKLKFVKREIPTPAAGAEDPGAMPAGE